VCSEETDEGGLNFAPLSPRSLGEGGNGAKFTSTEEICHAPTHAPQLGDRTGSKHRLVRVVLENAATLPDPNPGLSPVKL